MIKVGDTVKTGVYVLGQFKPMHTGVVVHQSDDRSVSWVDVGSLRGCQPWLRIEVTSQLHIFTEETE